MLVLTRRIHERLMIGDDVELVVISVQGQRVRLGIAAPAETPIRRAELCAALPFQIPSTEGSENVPAAMVAVG